MWPMLRVVSDGLWAELSKLGHQEKKFAAVSYVTSESEITFGKGDVLVCDASDEAIRAGQTSASLLRAIVERGGKVFSSPGLHAKSMVLGRVAVVGSANMSEASATQLIEAALITDDARAVAGVRVFVDQLTQDADVVDRAFLDRIAKLPVNVRARGSHRKRTVVLKEPRAWFVSVGPLDEERYKHEAELVETERAAAQAELEDDESEAGYVRLTGNSLFKREAQPGDIVILVWTPNRKSRRGSVYAPAPILRRKDVGDVTHFFTEEYIDHDDTAISFSSFKKHWDRLGGKSGLNVKSIREVSVDLVEAARREWSKR